MIRLLLGVTRDAVSFLWAWLDAHLLVLGLLGIGALGLWIWLLRVHPESAAGLAGRARAWGGRAGVWLLVAGLAALEVLALQAVREGTIERLTEQSSALYSATEDPTGGETRQASPWASFEETTVRDQSLAVPSYLLEAVRTGGLRMLPGWDPEELAWDDRPLVRVDDELAGDLQTAVIHRRITFHRHVPIRMRSSAVDLNLSFRGREGGARAYQATFRGGYTFVNPAREARQVRFTFPLPANSGTLSGFRMTLDERPVEVADLAEGVTWEGEVPAGGTVRVAVEYQHQGARSWTYDLARRREPIQDFQMSVATDEPRLKYLRGSLLPTQVERAGLASTRLTWKLTDLITSQDISLYFPGHSQVETVSRLLMSAPLLLLGWLLYLPAWAASRRAALPAGRVAVASLGMVAGVATAGYLITYMPFLGAVLVGAASGAALALAALGTVFAVPIGLAAAAHVAFAWTGNTGLVLCLLAMLGLLALLKRS